MSLVRYAFVLIALVCPATQLSAAPITDADTLFLGNFTNNTGHAIFDGSLEQPLRTALDESPFLSVLPDASVVAALRDLGHPSNEPLTPELSRALCQRLNTKAYVTGSIGRHGTEILITLRVDECESGKQLAQVQTPAVSKDKVLDALGDAAGKLRIQLGESPESVRAFSTPLSRATSASFEALKAWSAALKAQQESAALAEGSEAALPLLENAVKLDPNFASAIFAIGYIYRDALQEERAREYLIRAFDLRDHASVRDRSRIAGMYYSFVTVEYEKAVAAYQKWTGDYPRDEKAVSNFGSFYGDVCRYKEAIAQFEKARRMNPGDVIAHEDLIEILLADGQFDKAREAYQEMLRMNLDDDAPHLYLYAIATLEHDPKGMAQQVAWFDGKPQLQHEMLSEEADAEAYGGHLARARELTSQAVGSAIRADNKEQAAAWQLNSAWREELFGNTKEAREQTLHALEIAPDSREEGAVAAILLARTGEIAKAGAIAKDLEQRYPVHAVVQSYWLPCIHAQMSLAAKHPEAALQQLEKTRPYDTLLPQVAFYSPMFSVVLRAEAYLAQGQPAAAAKEWDKISQYPGIVQLSASAPISRLQFARTLVFQHRKGRSAVRAQARSAYDRFLALWRDADSDIRILKEARAEFAALN